MSYLRMGGHKSLLDKDRIIVLPKLMILNLWFFPLIPNFAVVRYSVLKI